MESSALFLMVLGFLLLYEFNFGDLNGEYIRYLAIKKLICPINFEMAIICLEVSINWGKAAIMRMRVANTLIEMAIIVSKMANIFIHSILKLLFTLNCKPPIKARI